MKHSIEREAVRQKRKVLQQLLKKIFICKKVQRVPTERTPFPSDIRLKEIVPIVSSWIQKNHPYHAQNCDINARAVWAAIDGNLDCIWIQEPTCSDPSFKELSLDKILQKIRRFD